MALNNLLIEECQIYNRSTVINQFGDSVDTYTLFASNVKCRIVGNSTSFGQYSGQVGTQSIYNFYIDEDYVLDSTNTIKINDLIYHVTFADAKNEYGKIHHNYYEISIIESPQSGRSVYG